jgi:GT2 family glycosyltransferase
MACGFVAKKDVLLKVGGFDPELFRQGEERDLVIRIINAGFDVIQDNDIEIFHELSVCERDDQYIHGYAFRNELFFYLKYFPSVFAIIFLIKCFVSHTVYCFKNFLFKAYFFGVSRFFLDLPKFIIKRKPVKVKTVKRFLFLKR